MGKRLSQPHTRWRLDEVTLVELVSRGYAKKEIASLFGVSVAAAKKRLAPAMERFGVDDRASLVRAAFDAGVLVPGIGHDGRPSGC